ncbi:hypothetical protein [Streptomyces sp. NBC_00344]|uniref:hypothetical protein n=1 Tax=Streptomyces sp. NBC_00344 TaxID=2975720 RepID=UPI002E202C37
MIKNLTRAAMTVALTAAPFTMTGPAHAGGTLDVPQANPCATVVAYPGYACVPTPKQCFTQPCPQYDIVPMASAPLEGGVPVEGTAGTF